MVCEVRERDLDGRAILWIVRGNPGGRKNDRFDFRVLGRRPQQSDSSFDSTLDDVVDTCDEGRVCCNVQDARYTCRIELVSSDRRAIIADQKVTCLSTCLRTRLERRDF
jgi:hypothetical protein